MLRAFKLVKNSNLVGYTSQRFTARLKQAYQKHHTLAVVVQANNHGRTERSIFPKTPGKKCH